jgi:nicotinamide-nucleotide amidase
MKAAIISIGNELLLGKTINSNMAWLGAELAKLGVPLDYAVTIKDDPIEILKALNDTWNKYDVVITTGGLGPTEDDLTKAVIADFFAKELYFDEEVWLHVQSLFTRRNMPTPVLNRSQAMVPEGFIPLTNDRGTAPGLFYQEGRKLFFALQGVPLEMKFIFETHIKEIIRATYPDAKPVFQKTIHTHGVSESRLAELFKLEELPEGVALAWLPQTGRVDMRFYGTDKRIIQEAVDAAVKAISPYLWGVDGETPAGALLRALEEHGYTISLAESCTGGWISKLLTDVPGASKCYLGGLTAYSNDLKLSALGVKENTLSDYGAVSAECAQEMVWGIKELTKSSHAISVTGIAGPDGGSTEKEIGTVYFGFIAREKHWYSKQLFIGDRDSIRFKAAEFAILELLKVHQGRNT